MTITLVSLLTLASTATAAVWNTGYLIANTDHASDVDPPVTRIGCVGRDGRVGTEGCAHFTLYDNYTLVTEGVRCTTFDNTQPENTDASKRLPLAPIMICRDGR